MKVDENYLTEEQYLILEKFMSNPRGNVNFIKNLDPPQVGAILARISRAPYSIRGTLLNEYLAEDGSFDNAKASTVVNRVLNQFGDDSVAELGGAHVFFTAVSNLSTKEIEDCRIGGSPIEESTRYVEFDKKDANGHYKYVDIVGLPSSLETKYQSTMNFIFDVYSEMLEPMKEYFMKLNPLASFETAFDNKKYSELTDEQQIKMSEIAYRSAIRAQACDVIRCILPAATRSTLGIFGNGRFFTMLISKLMTSDRSENKQLALELKTELDKLMPEFIRRAAPNKYNKMIDAEMFSLAKTLFSGVEPELSSNVILLKKARSTSEEFDNMLADMLFPYTTLSMLQIRSFVAGLSASDKDKVFNTYTGARDNRRNRPGRAFENGYPIQYELVGTFAEYRDLQRHRMLTQQRQRLNPYLGFVMPIEIEAIGFSDKVKECVKLSKELYSSFVSAGLVEEAQYAVLFNHYIRFTMGMNMREASHLIELRTQKAGHPGYRKMCQEMGRELIARDGKYAELMLKFTDFNDYTNLTRGEAEAKTALKDYKLIK